MSDQLDPTEGLRVSLDCEGNDATLKLTLQSPGGEVVREVEHKVTIDGGDTFAKLSAASHLLRAMARVVNAGHSINEVLGLCQGILADACEGELSIMREGLSPVASLESSQRQDIFVDADGGFVLVSEDDYVEKLPDSFGFEDVEGVSTSDLFVPFSEEIDNARLLDQQDL